VICGGRVSTKGLKASAAYVFGSALNIKFN
jgi:hypothetical protein